MLLPCSSCALSLLPRTTIHIFEESLGKPEQRTFEIMLYKLLIAQELEMSGWIGGSKSP